MTDQSPNKGEERASPPKVETPSPDTPPGEIETTSADKGKEPSPDAPEDSTADNQHAESAKEAEATGSKGQGERAGQAVEEESSADDDTSDEDEDDDDGDEEDEEEEEDEEPRLKYARLTQHLNGVYRNGDATSAFLVAGDKMARFFQAQSKHQANLGTDYWNA